MSGHNHYDKGGLALSTDTVTLTDVGNAGTQETLANASYQVWPVTPGGASKTRTVEAPSCPVGSELFIFQVGTGDVEIEFAANVNASGDTILINAAKESILLRCIKDSSDVKSWHLIATDGTVS